MQVDNGEGEKEPRLIGFISIPVFPVEMTEGEDLEYESIPLPDVPLLEVAIKWGISVKSVPGNNRFQGMFRGGRREILLATPEESVFFHELSHAAHEKVLKARGDTMKGGQNAKQEMVAELSAAVLCRLCGKSDKDTSGNSYRYIQSYAGKDMLKGIASIIGDVEKVLARIMEAGNVEAMAA